MKKIRIVIFLILNAVLVLSACGVGYTKQICTSSALPTLEEDYQPMDTSYHEVSYDVYSVVDESAYPLNSGNSTLLDNDLPDVSNINLSILQDRIFVHEGEKISIDGDELSWYYNIFGSNVNGICGLFIDFVGTDEFRVWTHQFIGHGPDGYAWRNSREANLLSFIEDFGLTMPDLIKALESGLGMSIYELDALVNWGRYGTHSFEEESDASFWACRYSLSDLEVLFSNDLYLIWATFPGPGVFHNGNVYSPEWILNNMEQAVIEKQIPFHEIDRILGYAVYHPQLNEVRIIAETTLQAVR